MLTKMHFKIDQLLFLIILSFIPGQIHMDLVTTCEKGWVSYQKSCYYFSTSTATFKEALSACYRIGAELLELQNAKEEKWLDNQARLRDHTSQIWLGANDVQEEGQFISVSKAEGLHYSHWMAGEPDKYKPELENCATYWPYRKGMNDESCYTKCYYVCKK